MSSHYLDVSWVADIMRGSEGPGLVAQDDPFSLLNTLRRLQTQPTTTPSPATQASEHSSPSEAGEEPSCATANFHRGSGEQAPAEAEAASDGPAHAEADAGGGGEARVSATDALIARANEILQQPAHARGKAGSATEDSLAILQQRVARGSSGPVGLSEQELERHKRHVGQVAAARVHACACSLALAGQGKAKRSMVIESKGRKWVWAECVW